MVDDRRAHDRIDCLEKVVADHLIEQTAYQKLMAENTAMTQAIADNTSELVAMVKGAKGLRSAIMWWGPVAAFLIGTWAIFKDHWK